MEIQKYKAKIVGSELEAVGYISETRKYLGKGTYSNKEIDYLITVTSISMPKGNYGTYKVIKESITPTK